MAVKQNINNDVIEICGARVHNLKNISLTIPHNKFIVITGLSGSGKSSLAFDTLFAEGQRRYVESLSSYARQFLGRINKPEVDNIHGISPAIAIEQKVSSRNPRSTVGTTTEIYDYLKLLFARLGKIYSPITDEEVRIYTSDDIARFIENLAPATRVVISAPIILSEKEQITEKLLFLMSNGFDSLFLDGKTMSIEEVMPFIEHVNVKDIRVVIDKIVVSTEDEDFQNRVSDSVERAYYVGDGRASIFTYDREKGYTEHRFSSMFDDTSDIHYEQPNEYLFSFNNPVGACPECEGYGKVVGIDEDLVVPDKSKSLFDDAVACWRGETMRKWKEQVIYNAEAAKFPIHRPYYKLSDAERKILWKGCAHFKGIDAFFASLEKEKYKIQYRVLISRYTGKRICPECNGTRLKKEATYIKVGGYRITELIDKSIVDLIEVFNTMPLDSYDKKIAKRIFQEITSRLQYLKDVGLEYLTLNRLSNTLSGGESQRINLATSLGSALVGSMYILDEPSIGLHPRDTERLIKVLKQLRDLGNTVIVVEHDEEIMRAADQIIDIGPFAGVFGGEVVFQGSIDEIKNAKNSLTADYILGKETIERLIPKRKLTDFIEVNGARENNLKNINVKFPIGAMACVTGVSGSGKSSLVKDILYPALFRHFNKTGFISSNFEGISGALKLVRGVEMIDQNPIGRSSRSNPVTYIKAYDEIRKLFAEQQSAKQMGYSPSYFSFNIAGGRCEECQGEGVLRVEMQFMADVEMVCDACEGKRFKRDILEVKYRGKNISEILEMSIDEAVEFFKADNSTLARKVVDKLTVLQNVGLGYIALGQSSSTLSGGESQRVKLASFLLKDSSTEPLVFIFDEPTTGLHFHDIKKLLQAFDALVAKGHTLIVVEHNLEVVKCADWIVDLGAEGGDKGGELIYQGDIDGFMKCEDGYTQKFMKIVCKIKK
ncbi:MAG: excinuclease ABC subunit UvrA [Rikenellaceae bacterium]